MKNKISYLVLCAFLMVGGMDSALAAQGPAQAVVAEANGIVFKGRRTGSTRLHRRTKCYSKSAEMLSPSVLSLINKFNSRPI